MSNSISKVWFDEENILIEFEGNAIVRVPLTEYPRLQKATSIQREKYELWNNGKWLHWEELDEDLSAEGFLNYSLQNSNTTTANQ